jgi:HAD superfamily hydrolase (TIGR01490 family)
MTVAIFDLDETLLDGDSEGLWIKFLAERHLVDAEFITRVIQYTQSYEIGQMDFNKYETYFLSIFQDIKTEELPGLLDGYLQLIRSHLRPELLQRLADHRARGHQILLITASNTFLAGRVADLLGVTNLIGTEIEVDSGGKPTGKITGLIPFQKVKVALLEGWLNEKGYTLQDSWGYSDSCNDLPMLQKVTHPVAVAPDELLREHALKNGWEIILDSSSETPKAYMGYNFDLNEKNLSS